MSISAIRSIQKYTEVEISQGQRGRVERQSAFDRGPDTIKFSPESLALARNASAAREASSDAAATQNKSDASEDAAPLEWYRIPEWFANFLEEVDPNAVEHGKSVLASMDALQKKYGEGNWQSHMDWSSLHYSADTKNRHYRDIDSSTMVEYMEKLLEHYSGALREHNILTLKQNYEMVMDKDLSEAVRESFYSSMRADSKMMELLDIVKPDNIEL